MTSPLPRSRAARGYLAPHKRRRKVPRRRRVVLLCAAAAAAAAAAADCGAGVEEAQEADDGDDGEGRAVGEAAEVKGAAAAESLGKSESPPS